MEVENVTGIFVVSSGIFKATISDTSPAGLAFEKLKDVENIIN